MLDWDIHPEMDVEIASEPRNVFFRCVEDANEAIMISDRAGRLIYVNPAWCRIYGYSRAEAVGKTPALLHSGTQSAEFYQTMWEQILDPARGSWKGELVNRAKDGTLVPVLLSITAYRSVDSSEIRGYMGIAVDLTASKSLEAQVAHQDRLASVGMLASGLAHEIGTPLGVIRGRAEFLMMKSTDDTVRKGLEIITSEIDRISKLIRSLLRVSRTQSKGGLETISLSTAVEETLALVGQNAREVGMALSIAIPSEFQVRADPSKVSQVLLNLIVNSIHAVAKAKSAGRTDGHCLKLSAQLMPSGFCELAVEDTGCGIPPGDMAKLFTPFFTTKDVGQGTGLGLAIVAQLMREMGGTVAVRSQLGAGTVFTLAFRSASSA